MHLPLIQSRASLQAEKSALFANEWRLQSHPGDADHHLLDAQPARTVMAGGGAAPSMKMSDVFLLIGMSILLGGLIMHVWVSPTSLEGEMNSKEGGASMLKSDSITFKLNAINTSTFSIAVYDEANEEVFTTDGPLSEGEDAEIIFTAEEAGFYTYTIVFETGQGEVLVDVDRNTKIDFLPYPIGLACILFGLYKRGFEDDGAIDAELED